MVSSCGNISVRLPDSKFAISASGASLPELTEDEVCIGDLNDLQSFQGPRPSIETSFHRKIYQYREDVGAVLHFQSLYATTLACAEKPDFNLNFIPEIPIYIKKISIVSFFVPGSEALAEAVGETAADPDCSIIILKNHGQIAMGKDLKSMLRSAEFFEFACQVACQNIPLERFSEDVLSKLKTFC